MLPKDNELSVTTYEAKQVVYPLGLEIQKIHACPNDCILYLAQVLAEGPSAPKVNPWKKFEHGKSLYNPEALGELGTQMYLLNKWYMAACERGETTFVFVRVRNQHYFRGDDVIYVEFLELHQLCHMYSLDKSLISCYCL